MIGLRLYNKLCLHQHKKKIVQRPSSSYHDRIDTDNTNRIFYIYYLGRYHNAPIYHYGECMDLDVIEFTLKKTIPFYEKVLYIPMDHHFMGKDKFDFFVNKHNLRIEIPILNVNLYDIITTSDIIGHDEIVAEVYNIFKTLEVENV